MLNCSKPGEVLEDMGMLATAMSDMGATRHKSLPDYNIRVLKILNNLCLENNSVKDLIELLIPGLEEPGAVLTVMPSVGCHYRVFLRKAPI